MSERPITGQDFQAGLSSLRSNQIRSVAERLSKSGKAHDIEEGYKKRGVSSKEAERRVGRQ